MRLLLDTHAFIWAAAEPDKLSSAARGAIADRANDVFVSAAAAWEITIEAAIGKISLPADPAVWFPARVASLGFQMLDITAGHALAIAALPGLHQDPFDRMMIAQAQLEGLTFVTRDAQNQKYPVHFLAA